MIQVLKETNFAVVDLETTGTSKEQGDRIIQFGCAIIRNFQVAETYSIMINPEKDIPISVQNLTGISNDDVKDAPLFKEIAPKISQILENTVFVAHNINFDLPFLNHELKNAGLPEFKGRAIDTVQLAKIAFPTLPSYRLVDLTNRLDIKHLNPHQADSDAYGTAILLLDIFNKLASLPQSTLNQLRSLSKNLLRDTSWIFKVISDELRQDKRPLDKGLMQVRNLVLKKQITDLPARENYKNFPKKSQLKNLLTKKLTFRQCQFELINQLHSFLQTDSHPLLIEAPNGTGKTLSYLLGYVYALKNNKKLVISTPTRVLQNQLINVEIPKVKKITGLDLSAESVKSSRHYLDLDGFYQTLQEKTTNLPTLVLQMQLLVWLTETETGDLDELELTNFQNPLFKKVIHPGDARVGSLFSDVDFWNLARLRQEQADILVTNHAYLASHYQETIWGAHPYLVVDEAHRLRDAFEKSLSDGLQFESLWGQISHLRNLLFFNPNSVALQFRDEPTFTDPLAILDEESNNLINKINRLQKILVENKAGQRSEYLKQVSFSFAGKDLFNSPNFQTELSGFNRLIEELRQKTDELVFKLIQQKATSLVDDILSTIDQLDFYMEKSFELSDLITDQEKLENMGFTVTLTNRDDPFSANLSWMNLDPTEELTGLYRRFDHPAFVSATLSDGRSFDFAKKQLAVTNAETILVKQGFNYQNKLHVLSVTDFPTADQNDFISKLANLIIDSFQTQSHVLILMTNLSKIQELYSAIVNEPLLKEHEIIAQGISGSNQKLIKRFKLASQAILIAADSFWEGVDFHDSQLDIVVATKLPFENPDQPEVKLRKGDFNSDSLPRAVIKFRQGMGRLIRGEDDHGIFMILDPRIWTKDYGNNFLKTIPVKVQKVKLKDVETNLKHYDSI
ncbi:MAG: exonuclease domain-containing protein [Lactobacillus sp.]|nr:exonuclease domain-containing protein [Lactobacillus sp.]